MREKYPFKNKTFASLKNAQENERKRILFAVDNYLSNKELKIRYIIKAAHNGKEIEMKQFMNSHNQLMKVAEKLLTKIYHSQITSLQK